MIFDYLLIHGRSTGAAHFGRRPFCRTLGYLPKRLGDPKRNEIRSINEGQYLNSLLLVFFRF